MRRFFSISLILLLWFGPFAAMLPAGAEAGLPMCCRRNGAHHCMGMDEHATNGSPEFRAPSRCPVCPRALQGLVGSQLALAPAASDAHAQRDQSIPMLRSRLSIRTQSGRTASDRGPPAPSMA